MLQGHRTWSAVPLLSPFYPAASLMRLPWPAVRSSHPLFFPSQPQAALIYLLTLAVLRLAIGLHFHHLPIIL